MHPFKALRAHQLQSVLDNLINQIIQQRKSKDDRDDKNDLLSLLLQAQDPESKYKLTDVEVHDEILTFLLAGFETITSQLCWVLYHLGELMWDLVVLYDFILDQASLPSAGGALEIPPSINIIRCCSQ